MSKQNLIRLAACLCAVTLFFAPALAIERYDVDEEVEVFHLNKWIPARVRDCGKKGDVLGEFEFAGVKQHHIFAPEHVRHKYESGAIARGRNWSDATASTRSKPLC